MLNEAKNPYLHEYLNKSEWEQLELMFDPKLSLRRRFAYAIPCQEEAQKIKEFLGENLDIVEHGAGTGYWAWYLSQFEIRVTAYDKYLLNDKYFVDDGSVYHHVDLADEAILSQHSENPLLLCWPPYNTSMALDCLLAWYNKSIPSQKFIYIGEGHGGCTGDDNFHDFLQENFEELDYMYQKYNWCGINSSIYLYTKKVEHEEKESIEPTCL